MKTLLIICDGIGDRLTNGRTPLEAAEKPGMDRIAREGINGIMHAIRPGIRPGSDTAHLSLLGYDPFKVYTGRGPFEAMGEEGVDLMDGDVALRCNFATLSEEGKIVDRRAGRNEQGLEKLASEIGEMEIRGVKVIFRKCTGHRGVLILRSAKNHALSHRITDTDPESLDALNLSRPLDKTKEAQLTADVLNEFTARSQSILKKSRVNEERIRAGTLPANAIVARGAGVKPYLEPFREKHGVDGAAIVAVDLIRGICRAVGIDVINVKGANGHVTTNLREKTRATIDALKTHDFVLLHIKGADEASHDGNFEEKKRFIEKIDKEVISPLLLELADTTIALTADHSTPVGLKQHSADSVPVAIRGDVRVDLVEKFDERSCARGGLSRIEGSDLVNILLDLSNKKKLFGA